MKKAKHLNARVNTMVLPSGARITEGDRVRLRPRPSPGVFDVALDGRPALVAAIEKDVQGRHHIGVIADDDPYMEPAMRLLAGSHFFFDPDEIEPIEEPDLVNFGSTWPVSLPTLCS